MTRQRFEGFLPLILFFVALNLFFIPGKPILEKWKADQNVLIIGNVLLFLLSMVSFLLAKKGMNNPNPHAFVRSVYVSVMVKLFVCMIAAFVYISMYKKDLNKPALFICMGLYLVYTFMEVSALMKMLKQK
ncbi:MAG TPA: hypothetical protein VNR87_18280 [Flavisolibacter sp.]|nr:hypothetical protein [Flavisolibacter sp.]